MQAFSKFVVKYKWLITVVILALSVLSVFSMNWVEVESNIMTYLPPKSQAKQGLDLMDREFITYAAEDIMVRVRDEAEAQEICDMLSELPGTLLITFDTTSEHIKNGYALYNVTYIGEDGSDTAKAAASQAHAMLSRREHYVYTSSLVNASAELADEMIGVGIIVALVILLVTFLTSTSFAEVPVLIITFGVAALLNMGTNFLLGKISLISNSVATIMQLALSIDYAIIFCNRYKEKHLTKSIEDAVAASLAESIKEILSSSTTTIAGLLSMTFMQFRLGRDLGICLIKAVFMSLFSVFVVMPVLLLLFGRLMDKTKHRKVLLRVDFLGRFAYAGRKVVPFILLAAAVAGCITFGKVKYAYSTDLINTVHSNQNERDGVKIQSIFGSNNMIAVMIPSGDNEREAALIEEIESFDEVKRVIGLANISVNDDLTLTSKIDYRQFMDLSDCDEATAQALFAYYAADAGLYSGSADDVKTMRVSVLDLFLTVEEVSGYDTIEITDEQLAMIDSMKSQLQMAQDQLQGDNYSRILVYADVPIQGDASFRLIDKLNVIASEYYDNNVVITGNTVAARDFYNTFSDDSRTVSIFSIGMVMLILLFTFRSIAMPILLILVIQGSIWMNFSTPVIMGNFVYFMVYVIVSAIQMGANIDYAIVISSRYNELRGSGLEPKQAMIDTMNLEFPTIITSGTIMAVSGIVIGMNVSDVAISGIGLYLGKGTIITLLIVNFALPQVLIFSDSLVRKTPVRFRILSETKTAKRVMAGFLAAASLTAIFVLPGALKSAGKIKTSTVEDYRQLIRQTEELRALAKETAERNDEFSTAKQEYAEAVTTVSIGSEQLEDGKKELEEGKETLEEYKEKLKNGEAQYYTGVNKYNEGLEQYEKGLAEYNAAQQEYEAGAAKLAEGQAQYDAGAAMLAQGQAEYDAGAAKLASAKTQYNTAKAEMDLIEPVFNRLFAAYSKYTDARAKYDEAVASGDSDTASSLWAQVTLNEILWKGEESLTGVSMDEASARYRSAKAELADAETQIADAEAQLADAKRQLDEGQAELDASKIVLDDGKAQLADAKAQLDAGQKELDEGKQKLEEAKKLLDYSKYELDSGAKQIGEGEEELIDAETQLAEGQKTIDEKQEQLKSSIDALQSISDAEDRLSEGIKILKEEEGISALISGNAGDEEICAAALMYYNDQISALEKTGKVSGIVIAAMFVSAVLGMAAAGLCFISTDYGKYICLAACALSFVSALLLRAYCGALGKGLLFAALSIAVVGLTVSLLGGKKKEADQI